MGGRFQLRHSGDGSIFVGVIAAALCAGSGAPMAQDLASDRLVVQSVSGDALPLNDGTSAMRSEMQATIDAALADAAKRTGIERSSLTVVSSQAVTWPDGSLGCRTTGRSYIQALTPGYRILIQAGASILEYHTDKRMRMVVCARGAPAPSNL